MVHVDEESVSAQVDALREELSQDVTQEVFLDNVLNATGKTLTAGQKEVAVIVLTKEQMLRKFYLRTEEA